MDELVNSAERLNVQLQLPALVIIEPVTLTRTCILSVLRRELIGFDIIDMATTDGLGCAAGRDVRLVVELQPRAKVPGILWQGRRAAHPHCEGRRAPRTCTG